MEFKLALILDCVIVGGIISWLTEDNHWITAILSSVICTVLLSAAKWLFCDGIVKFGLDFFLILLPMTFWGVAEIEDDSSPSTSSYGAGVSRTSYSNTEYTVYWNWKYHLVQIYEGESLYSSSLYEIDLDELEKANYSTGHYVYIRNSATRSIEYTLIPGNSYGNTYVVSGSTQYGEIAYTINGEYICRGKDDLNYNIIFRIREISSERKIIERY
ncbi:MAG: hypothetical protein IJ115_00020 [Erysipelotrichaceae bacterium]|nr:hypothetical protein [Erysipelotrichaceae bacterium]